MFGLISPFIRGYGKGYEGYHHQIFFGDGKEPSNLGLFDDDQVRPDDAPAKLQAKYEKINQGFDSALMRQAIDNVARINGTDWKPNSNCQDFTQNAIDEYFRLKDVQLKKKKGGGS